MSAKVEPRPSIWRPMIAGVLGGVTAWFGMFLAVGALRGLIEPLGQPAGKWAGLSVLLCVTFGVAVALARRTGPGGLLAAGVAGVTHSLLLLSMLLTAADGDSFNPLIFGWGGLSANLLLALAGGWLGQRWRRQTDGRSGLRPGIRLGLNAMLMWVGFEFIIRLAGTSSFGAVLGSPVGGDMLAVLLMLPTAVHWITKYAAGQGVTPADWGYRRDRQAVVAGLLGGLLLLLVNGIVIPICEERVWRGVIQTSLVRGWGTGMGLTVTALAFSLKHAIIDGSPGRLTVLFVFGLMVGLIRIRWSTTASTLAHCVTNLAATALLVAPVLRGM